MALIIEELNRAQHVQARYRMDGQRFTLGRSYSNDIILEDVHADAEHAEIFRGDDGCYYLRDLDTVNGTQLLGNRRDKAIKAGDIRERMILSGDEVQFGMTHFRLTDSETAMAPAVPLHSMENLFERLSHPALGIGLLLAVIGAFLLISYFGSAQKFQWNIALNLVAGSAVGLLGYAAAWAFIGRVVRHETQFFTHLTIAALAALVYLGWERISNLLDFNFSMGSAIPLLNLAVLMVLLPAMLWCACYLATNMAPRWRWAVALLVPIGFLGLELADQVGNIRDFNESPQISTTLKHDNWLWRKPVAMEQFIQESPQLFDIPIEKDKGHKSSEEAEVAAPPEDGDSAIEQAYRQIARAAS